MADIVAHRSGRNRHPVAFAASILLDDHGVSPGGQGCACEDPHSLASAKDAFEPVACRALADDGQGAGVSAERTAQPSMAELAKGG